MASTLPSNKDASQIELSRLTLIEAKVANERKSTGLAYLLWFFLGGFGIHNFYLGRPLIACFQLIGMPLGIILGSTGVPVGFAISAIVALSLLLDLFLIPGKVRSHSNDLRLKMQKELDTTEQTYTELV